MSHQRDNVTKDPSCRTQCVRGWDHRILVRRGHLRLRPGRRIPTPQLHPPPWAIPYIKQCDKMEGIHQMNLPQAPSIGGWTTCSPRLLASVLSITSLQEGFSFRNFLRMTGLVIRLIISCTTSNSWLSIWGMMSVVQGIPRQPTRPSSFVVPSTPYEFYW